jgi:hypothetical protein
MTRKIRISSKVCPKFTTFQRITEEGPCLQIVISTTEKVFFAQASMFMKRQIFGKINSHSFKVENYIQEKATKVEKMDEHCKTFKIDRSVNIYSKELYVLDKKTQPDHRLQEFNIETDVQHQVAEFLCSDEYNLAVLLGPTGCGKTQCFN